MKQQPAPGKLYLIPTPIHEDGLDSIPEMVIQKIRRLDYFVVERLRTARRFIRLAGHPSEISSLDIREFNKDTRDAEIPSLFKEIMSGRNCGVLSEAGCPGVADPGARLVSFAHAHGIQVFPLAGPSSILLALMSSGLIGQCFTFHGYLPAKRIPQKEALMQLEKKARLEKYTQIFMETPYRNRQVLDLATQVLNDETIFCVASALLSSKQYIKTLTMREWRKTGFPVLHKSPTIFLIGNSKRDNRKKHQ